MTELAAVIVHPRREFGKHCKFSATNAVVLAEILPKEQRRAEYILKNPIVNCFDTSPPLSEHTVDTTRVVMKTSSMSHTEGGWAKEIDASEQSDTSRFRKKTEKDDDYKQSVRALGPTIAQALRQNITVDIYEEYFANDTQDHSSEPASAKGVAVFKDPHGTSDVKRTVSSISWHPELSKIAVTYSLLSFQDARTTNTKIPTQSYIWDITNPNTPEYEIIPPSPLCCLKFNPKNPDTLVGGSYNGLVTFYDLRRVTPGQKEVTPAASSLIEKSHHDPVYNIFWINSKTGNQCVSLSTDGQILWWDTRKLSEPTDAVELCVDVKSNGQVLGGSSLEYNSEAGPSKYLVGTEQGVVLMANLKNRKQNNGISVFDQGPGKHHGPICSIQRNPCNTKIFLTVGDWTAKIWNEDIKTPIMTSKYHAAYLTSGCWSPTRPGVFFVTRMDGAVDIWDYHYRQNEAAYSHKVSDVSLSSISVQSQSQAQAGGKLVAVGDVNGTVTLLELCDSLATPQLNEKKAIDLTFEREFKQEKNLEVRERDLRKLKSTQQEQQQQQQTSNAAANATTAASGGATANESQEKRDAKDERMEALLRKVDADFLAMIKEAEDDEAKADSHLEPEANNTADRP